MTVDPSLKLTYKNYYWKGRDSKLDPKTYRDEWVHGVVMDFDSGYINDMVGFVMTAGFADSLDTTENTSITNVSKGDDGKANGIAGVQQAYLKGRYNISDLTLEGSYGIKKRNFALYGDSGSRVLAASSRGVDLSAHYMGLTVYGSYIDGGSNRNSSNLVEDLTVLGGTAKLDNIQIVGAHYEIAGLGLSAEQLTSKDYMKKHFAMVDYKFDLSDDMAIMADARYGHAKGDGDLMPRVTDSAGQQHDYKSAYTNLNVALQMGNAYVGVGYNEIHDGDWISDNADQAENGSFNSSLSLYEDFLLEGEKGYVMSAGYNFADFNWPGFSVDVYVATSDNAKNYNKDFGRDEWGSKVTYAFGGQFDGLELVWKHYNYKADGTHKTDNSKDLSSNLTENRFYLTYTYAVF